MVYAYHLIKDYLTIIVGNVLKSLNEKIKDEQKKFMIKEIDLGNLHEHLVIGQTNAENTEGKYDISIGAEPHRRPIIIVTIFKYGKNGSYITKELQIDVENITDLEKIENRITYDKTDLEKIENRIITEIFSVLIGHFHDKTTFN